ncbi:protein MEI2-like 6 [Populus alba]|uniref:protein MEI2-like 6 n=1 Tax=Populus alba TaxID=43335 RepID=UPI00158C2746|nr:protein MEI2-like 6 [Populus alba]
MEFLDSHCLLENEKAELQNSDSTKEIIESAFDLLYLPFDFEYKWANKGYAFVNFTQARAARKFSLSTSYHAGNVSQSNKTSEIACARLRGKGKIERHFEKSIFKHDSNEYLPVSFSPGRDDSMAMVKQRTVGSRIGNQIIKLYGLLDLVARM